MQVWPRSNSRALFTLTPGRRRRCGYVHRKHFEAEGHRDVATTAPEASIKSAADWLRTKNIGALVVTSGQAVLGLISEREIVHAFSRYGELPR